VTTARPAGAVELTNAHRVRIWAGPTRLPTRPVMVCWRRWARSGWAGCGCTSTVRARRRPTWRPASAPPWRGWIPEHKQGDGHYQSFLQLRRVW